MEEARAAQACERNVYAVAVFECGEPLLAKIRGVVLLRREIDLEARLNPSRRIVHDLDEQSKRVGVGIEDERLANRDPTLARLE